MEENVYLNKPIPAGKILAVSCIKTYLSNGEFQKPLTDMNSRIEYIKMHDSNGVEAGCRDRAVEGNRLMFFVIDHAGNYNLKIKFKEPDKICQFYLCVYTLDRIEDIQRFSRYDSLGMNKVAESDENDGTRHTYLIFNAPEHLNQAEQLGDNYKYISKMPINGNANIYWEHLNKYTEKKKYGILLRNPSDDTVNVTINKKSAYYEDNIVSFNDIPLKIWGDYNDGTITKDQTGITQSNRVLTIPSKASEWIYLDDIASPTDPHGILFNGIINLSVQNGKQLDCYAFMFSNTAGEQISKDFNLYNHSKEDNSGRYVRANDGYEMLSGTTDAPILSSGEIDLADRKSYRLLLTGYDAPFMNAGERTRLYYDGAPVSGNQHFGENAVNYSVIYKLNVKNFAGGKMILEYNKYTNAGYWENDWNGIYVAAVVKDGDVEKALLKKSGNLKKECDVQAGDAEIYLVVSGMSSMPLTVSFEED